MNDQTLAELCATADSLYERGYAHGSTGNLSVRVADEIWLTPTGQSLKGLTPARLAAVDATGARRNDNRPSKEFPFHLALYRMRADVNAVVHLHSTYAVALSCLADFAGGGSLPPLTPYYFMRVAPLVVLPYFRPGSPDLARAVEAAATAHDCMLLSNHGLVCAGATLTEAADRAEELEQTARLFFILRGERLRELSAAQVEELHATYGRK
jgi:ribulose-5-phosphate 4-epimerase/fuculose-1-phosphate aldolase